MRRPASSRRSVLLRLLPPALLALHDRAELGVVRDVAVVAHRHSIWVVNQERLGVFRAAATDGRVAHVPDADVAGEPLHVATSEDVANQPVAFFHVKTAVERHEACGVLATVLKADESFIQLTCDVATVRRDADESAHGLPVQAVSTWWNSRGNVPLILEGAGP